MLLSFVLFGNFSFFFYFILDSIFISLLYYFQFRIAMLLLSFLYFVFILQFPPYSYYSCFPLFKYTFLFLHSNTIFFFSHFPLSCSYVLTFSLFLFIKKKSYLIQRSCSFFFILLNFFVLPLINPFPLSFLPLLFAQFLFSIFFFFYSKCFFHVCFTFGRFVRSFSSIHFTFFILLLTVWLSAVCLLASLPTCLSPSLSFRMSPPLSVFCLSVSSSVCLYVWKSRYTLHNKDKPK